MSKPPLNKYGNSNHALGLLRWLVRLAAEWIRTLAAEWIRTVRGRHRPLAAYGTVCEGRPARSSATHGERRQRRMQDVCSPARARCPWLTASSTVGALPGRSPAAATPGSFNMPSGGGVYYQ